MKISLIVIGDEVLLGQVVDTNASTIAKMLYDSGLVIFKKWTVADLETEIIAALNEATEQSDMIIMTGGLGPTKDDITKKSIAKFMNQDLVFSEENKIHLTRMLARRNIPMSDLHLVQCYLPANAQLLDNQMGTALGMWMEHKKKIYISMPGVPYEMEYIMKHGVIPGIQAIPQEYKTIHHTIHTVGMGETEIAGIIEPKLGTLPEFISLAYLPAAGQVKLRITATHNDSDLMNREIESISNVIIDCIKNNIIGFDQTSLEEEIGNLLRTGNKTLACAESCTGGYLAHKITSVAGSSDYFKGSLIAYKNEIKHALLDVPETILNTVGPVSEECVRAMVEGAIHLFDTDYAIATSGIAGPGGGTEQIPTGTVWIAYGSKDLIKTRKYFFTRDRIRNIEAATTFGMIDFWKMLKDQTSNE